MPHDKNGAVLNVDDRVSVEFKIKEIHMAEDYCNVTLIIPGEHGPYNVVSTVVLNAKQVVKK
jgi:hypothetical protein